jgi:hypothetical protein
LSKYGRPKLKPHERRDAATLNVRLNKVEREIVKEKAAQAGVTLHEWARLAALEQDPPIRPIVPELNYEAWRETAKLLSTLKGAIWRFQPGMESSTTSHDALERLSETVGMDRTDPIADLNQTLDKAPVQEIAPALEPAIEEHAIESIILSL